MSITKRKKSVTADTPGRTEQRSGYFFVLIFVLMAIGIAAIGYFSYWKYQHNFRDQVERNLSTIANQKVDALVDWRQERLGDASIFFKNPVFTSLVRDFIQDPKNTDTRWRIQMWMGKVQTSFQYKGIRLFNTQGVNLLSVPANPLPASTVTLQYLPEVLRSGQVTFEDFYRNNYDQCIYLAVLVPILDEKNHNQPLAVLALRIDPNVYLYPFIQKWPTDSKTGETLLVRRDGNDVLFLNELRFQKDAALKLRSSLDKKELPAVKAVLGQEEIVEGKDYRGMRVLACIRAVPNSPWFLVARMDTSEVYAPIRERLGAIVSLVIILFFGAAIGLNLLRRQQNLHFYRKQSELAEGLRESEKRFQRVIDVTEEGIWEWNILTGQEFFSHRWCEIIGYSFDDPELPHTYNSWVERIHPDDSERVKSALKNHLEKGTKYDVEYRHRHKSGEYRWQNSKGQAILDESGKPTKMVGCISDITERKQAEGDLRESEERFRSIFDNSNDGIIVADTTTRKFLFGNQAICRMLGYTPEELRELGVNDIHPQKDLPAVMEAFDKQLRKEVEVAPGLPVQRKDGSIFYADVNAFPFHLEGKTCLGGVFRDITERKQAEEERNSLQEQLIRSEKLAAVGELIAGVVHEINNPLTGIKGLSELLLNETQDEEKKKDLKFIHQSSERIEKIVKNLQRFAHREKPSRKYVNINELIDVVISIRDYEMTARNIKIERHYQSDLPLVFTDHSQLEQVFLNLITNAEYAIHDNQEKAGTLTIATSVVSDNAGGTVVIEFSDTGAGIPIDVLPKIFNPFFTTKGVGKGTGLGLSVSYGIIKGHGGEINARNQAEGGAVFTIKLPVRGGGKR